MLQSRDDLVVARKLGSRLFLAGGPRMPVSFEGPSERTIFFRRDAFESELRRLSVAVDSVEARAVEVSFKLA